MAKEPHDVLAQMSEQMEAASFPVVLCDLDLRIIYRNKYVRENIQALNYPGALASLMDPERFDEVCKLLKRGESLQVDTVGVLLDTAISLSPMLEGGRPVGVFVTMVPEVGSFTDPSDLGANSSAVFSASFRQPLTDIFASLSVMNRHLQAQDNHSMDEYLRAINRSSYQMLRNTNNMMHRMSTFFAYRREPELVDVWERFAELLEASAIILRPMGVQLEYHLPEDTTLVRCDFNSVASAFMNLLSNAIRHGGADRYVLVTGKTSGTSVIISILDHGTGIPDELTNKVFSSYTSRSNKGRPYAGLGLGLTVARQMIQEAGGTIAINSTEHGTTVVFSLPVVTDGVAAPRLPMDCGSAAYLRDRFSLVYVGLCDVVEPPEQ